MEAILENYKEDYGSFIFKVEENLKKVCCAPNKNAGVYIFYDITSGQRNLIYVGCSGHIKNDGTLSVRKTGLGGIRGRIVNGHQFGKVKRFKSLPLQMKIDKISTLEIHWFVTHASEYIHSPVFVESRLLQNYFEENGKLPKWNMKF